MLDSLHRTSYLSLITGEYAGTFRWSQKKDFVQMPPYVAPSSIEGSWKEFFETRFNQEDVDDSTKMVLDVPMIDGRFAR